VGCQKLKCCSIQSKGFLTTLPLLLNGKEIRVYWD
jgi:hypothetical protein